MSTHYGMWAAAEDNLADAETSLHKWKAYARRLESSLEEANKSNARLREMYIDMSGAESAQGKLKELALDELAKFDPANRMLDKQHRKAIYDIEKSKVDAEMRKK